MRARLALLVSGTAVVVREVVLRDKPVEMVAASAKATVPVLVLPGGAVIDQSIDIMRWALRRHDPEDWLSGDDPALIASGDGEFKTHLDRYKYAERGSGGSIIHREAGLAWMTGLEMRLIEQDWLKGTRQTLADAALMPFVRQFATVDPDWFRAQRLPRLHDWLARQLASRLFQKAMTRLPKWQSGHDDVLLGSCGT